MSLVQLLAVGRSIRSIKDQPSRYRMTQENLVPRFSSAKESVERPALETPDQPVGRTGPPPIQRLMPQRKAKAERKSEKSAPGRPRPSRKLWVLLTKATRKAYSFGCWLLARSPFRRCAAEKVGPSVVQAELRLETVRVVRNDLQDADLEILPVPESAGTSPDQGEFPRAGWYESVRMLWCRIATRLFGAGRS
jgi:hypothetical protein